ncbi:MAG: IPT/TIG domain-containing protein [Opitutales bacterium]|nr:IPT/TIG domain-containing protein [Opitutales bacterium]
MAKKLSFVFSAAALLLSGCAGLTNLTPEKIPENSSGLYTLSMSAHINDGSIVPGSIEPFIVIDENTIPMKTVKNLDNERIYEYDYRLPKGRRDAKYYFTLKYKVRNTVEDGEQERTLTSPTVYKLEPVRRYVVTLQSERGPVGTVVPVLGRGFDKLDKIIIGGVPADTEYVSRATINFTVPPLKSGEDYEVKLVGSDNDMWIGQFRVDVAEMQVSPKKIDIKSGEIVNVIFGIGFTAPEGGYPIEVKTNIPSSVIMDEAVVPEGRSSVSVALKGGAEGEGFLYIQGVGFDEVKIPVSVKASEPKDELLSGVSEAVNEIDSAEGPASANASKAAAGAKKTETEKSGASAR